MSLTKLLIRGKNIYSFLLWLSLLLFLGSCSQQKAYDQSIQEAIKNDLAHGRKLLEKQPDSTLLYAQQALDSASVHKFQPLVLKSLALKAHSLLALGRNEEALSCYKKVLSMPLIEKDIALRTEIYKNLGIAEVRLKNYLSALINFRKVLNEAHPTDSLSVFAEAAENMGDLYAEMHYPNNALKYYGKAQDFRNNSADEKGYYLLQIKIGDAFLVKEQSQAALEAYTKALDYFEDNGNKNQQALATYKMASIQLLRKNPSLALEYAQKAQLLALEASDLEVLMQSYWILGRIHFVKENFSLAQKNFLESLEIADILNQAALKIKLYEQLAVVSQELNAPQEALTYFGKYNEAAARILKEHEEQKSEDILYAIKLDKGEREVASLKRKNAVIEKYSSIRSEGLGTNRDFIILLTAFVVVFILLIALYYKRFKDKKRTSLLLEQRVKERTEALHRTLQRLSFHVNNTSLAVIELNPKLEITVWSGQSEKIFGWDSRSVVGQSFFEVGIFEKETLKEIKAIFKKITKGKLSKKFMLTKNNHKDGHPLFIEWNFSVLYDERGEVTSVSCFANNVTHREKALLEAETANKELDNFIYKTSHDVKGPISRIEGLINLGIMEAQEEVSKNYFVMLQQVAANFNIVLSRLFRIHGIYYHEPVPVSLNLKKEISTLLQKLQKKNALNELKYKIDIPEDVQWNTDKLLFYIIIQNIYENALDYRRDGLSIIIFNVEMTNPSYLKLQIRDNGTCIPLQAADRIFDMFFQNTAESNTAGLGLYMVKKSVEKLGGSIKLLEEHKETFFEILLPAREK